VPVIIPVAVPVIIPVAVPVIIPVAVPVIILVAVPVIVLVAAVRVVAAERDRVELVRQREHVAAFLLHRVQDGDQALLEHEPVRDDEIGLS
jgi:hypothetical protein